MPLQPRRGPACGPRGPPGRRGAGELEQARALCYRRGSGSWEGPPRLRPSGYSGGRQLLPEPVAGPFPSLDDITA